MADAQGNDIVPRDLSNRGPCLWAWGGARACPLAVRPAEEALHLGLEDGLRLVRAGDLAGVLGDHGTHRKPGSCREGTMRHEV